MPRKDGQYEKMIPTPEQAELLRSLPHRVQSAIAFIADNRARTGKRYESLEPKHLRVGINNALVEASAIGRLLMEKGIITPAEYYDSIIELLEEEVRRYQEDVTAEFGPSVVI
jgi:hypothetical protein